MGTPSTTTTIVPYAGGTAPATFQNKGVLTYGIGEQANTADVRTSNASNNSGASGSGNVFFTSTNAAYGFSIESVNAAAFNTLQLSYNYRKESNTLFATFSVDYWNGAAWITIANTSTDLFNETASTTAGWFPAKVLALPAGAQIGGLKIRFVKTGTASIRIDDVKLTGTPAGGDVTAPTLSSFTPGSGATEVATSVTVIASFNEGVKAGTGAITLTNNATTAVVPATVAFAGSSLSIEPSAVLDTGVSYTVQIPNGAVTDLADNPYLGTSWIFTTDNTAPTLTTTLIPANDAIGVAPPTTLRATFNEPVNLPLLPGTATITVRNSSGTAVVTFDSNAFNATEVAVNGAVLTLTIPTGTPLDFGSTYYVEIGAGAVINDSGLPFVGYTGNAIWEFSTVDVPTITTGPGYSQDFSTFTSAPTLTDATPLLPFGWSVSSSIIPPDFSYDGVFGTGTTGGFRGGASVLAYQHTGSTGILTETLNLRNASGAPITDLIVQYRGRDGGPATGTVRNPVFTVSVAGTTIAGLTYTTSEGDDIAKAATISGLNIPNGATFSIAWSSDSSVGSAGSRRQIGISAVSVAIGVAQFPPSVSASVPLGTVTFSSADFNGTVFSEGTSPITERGFVYSETLLNANPVIGGPNVAKIIDPAIGGDPYTAAVSGLLSSTGYSVRAYAINSVNTSYSSPLAFTTLALPPTFTGLYEQPFDAYAGANPVGWSAISSGGAQAYAGLWGNPGGSAGFTGGESNPGVLGYQHTSGTGTLTTTLKLINGTGSTITELPVSYLGRASRTTEGRSPTFVVSVNGVEVPALAYSTLDNVDVSLSTTVTGLSIAPSALITITWVSDRGAGGGSSKQIGLGEVVVGTAIVTNTYSSWALANTGNASTSATLDHDNDGVRNGVEYFFGATGSTFTPNPQPNAAGLISFPHPVATPGTTYTVETSPDLVTWTPVTTSESGGFVNYTIPSGLGKVFVRLNVVTP